MKYLHLLGDEVRKQITAELPDRFGVLFDGWSDGAGSHYVGIFAEYTSRRDNSRRQALLALAPLLAETDLGAASHIEFFESTLNQYDKSLCDVAYLVGDNCNVNVSIANQTKLPLVGCASHRFNLAVKLFLESKEKLLEKVDKLMGKLRTVKNRAIFRKVTDVAPQRRNAI